MNIKKCINKCYQVEGIFNKGVLEDELYIIDKLTEHNFILRKSKSKNKHDILFDDKVIQTGSLKELAYFVNGLRSIIPMIKKTI
tara:strand:- start:185 stop:436 length:252 start_codon:yes stop_codon:yes gene_type:complete